MYWEFANCLFLERFIFLSCMFFTEYLGLVNNTLSHRFQYDRVSKAHGVVGLLILMKSNRYFMPKLLFCPQKCP